MNLEEVMTKEEQEAVMKLVSAHLQVQGARLRLWEAEQAEKLAAKDVTSLYFETGPDDEGYPVRVGTIPDFFVAYYGGTAYAIRIDTEGDHGHQVSLIAGVLGSHPNGH